MRTIKNVKTTVLLVDDHPIVLEGLRVLINTQEDMAVVGAAADGRTALLLVEKLRPDVVVLDLLMPKLNGIEAAGKILKRWPSIKILILSSSNNVQHVEQALEAGVAGYITKQTASTELFRAIRAVRQGHLFLSESISTFLLQRKWTTFAKADARRKDTNVLTQREKQVLQLVAQGYANKMIGDTLSISTKTVEKHRQKVMDKTSLHDTASLTRYAVAVGLSVLDQNVNSLVQTAKE